MELKNGVLEVNIKSAGAELTSIKRNGTQYLWHGKEYWKRNAPILFPIVGRLVNDEVIIEGNKYNMGQHGFARDMEFLEIESTKTSVTYLLKYDEETLKKYPYKFELYVSYKLEDNFIDVEYKIKNVDDKKIMFCIGGHPAFSWPIMPNEKFEDYYIKFEKEETQKYIQNISGCLKKTDEFILEKTDEIQLNKDIFKIDTFVLKNLNSSWVELRSKNSNKAVKLHFNGFPYLGIWSRTDEAPFVCLEPWVGVADFIGGSGKFEDKDEVVKLAVNEEFRCGYKIEIN